ncbi:ABC transporter substrate-binding protein [Brachyspira hampsonii]|uniref:ABC transporter substrate-binding protein n=1 Tax=Brachyspira hampsonii TaxID=1287055 RepID=A0AAC9XJ69_9SPIR|nr:sugar ABC transporter substrate-binding protein [Brachyspira hampsonii]ASJ20427.1 ABC transporter substrate-binding protein [Brachyspira hampsonii]ELV05390.1 extracellular solute-binding protein [Brachyspira hampsonii 30599]MBW5379659.1 sugar ABC transporter substrate-binding protein [Brachyspira hampsonii]MBW5409717.1 sugar ABC transporter substrate-binding protein [Brachyspira hampsonii]OEJ18606.1 ABC transporter substrate-binding protein [Brachyspira hampsonii]
MAKKLFILFFIAVIFIASCSKNNTQTASSTELPVIDENTETEITIWAWNVAARALTEMADIFMQKYPKIKVNVQEFGGVQAYEKYGVVLASGKEIPDIMQIESDFVQTYAENYPQFFLDMKSLAPADIDSKVDPSKVSTSYDSTGKLVAIAWDSGPVVVFYRSDLFKEAGIDPNTITTYDEYIAAGKKFQEKFPNIKFIGNMFVQDDGVWRNMLVQNDTYYLNKNGEITISSPKAIESTKVLRSFIDEGIMANTLNWDGSIRASKNGEIATYLSGAWWSGTIKDQMPEMKGKWAIMPMPAYTKGGVRASSHGGSTLTITASDPVKQAAAWAFIEHSLLNVDSQLLMYKNYGLFPSYLPVYDDPRFQEPDEYFGEGFNQMLGDITKQIPAAIYTSSDYSDIRSICVGAYEAIMNDNADIQKTLEDAASQISSTTGRTIAK